MKNQEPVPIKDCEIEILEIHDRQAWEIGMNDMDCAGIIPEEDDVIIPPTVKEALVTKMLEQKSKRRGR